VRNAGQGFYTFEVSDTGPGLDETAVHAVFQKYWQETTGAVKSSSDRPRSSGNSSSNRAALHREGSSASAATSTAATATTTADDDIEAVNESRGYSNASTQSLGLDTGCEGFGLGLNVSFNLVQILGGELSVQSHPGHTVFSFTIPMETAAEDDVRQPQAAQQLQHAQQQQEYAMPERTAVALLGLRPAAAAELYRSPAPSPPPLSRLNSNVSASSASSSSNPFLERKQLPQQQQTQQQQVQSSAASSASGAASDSTAAAGAGGNGGNRSPSSGSSGRKRWTAKMPVCLQRPRGGERVAPGPRLRAEDIGSSESSSGNGKPDYTGVGSSGAVTAAAGGGGGGLRGNASAMSAMASEEEEYR
jgi:hypothetical protein